MNTRRTSRQQGHTLVEVAIGMAVIGIVALGVSAGSGFLQRQTAQTQASRNVEGMIGSLLEQIRVSVNRFQINYEAADAGSGFERLTPDQLPLAWSGSFVTDSAACPDCPGKMGYEIRPVSGYRGLYLVSVRIAHRDVNNGQAKDLQFLVSGQ